MDDEKPRHTVTHRGHVQVGETRSRDAFWSLLHGRNARLSGRSSLEVLTHAPSWAILSDGARSDRLTR